MKCTLIFKRSIFVPTNITHSWTSAGPNCIIRRLCHSPIQYVAMTRIELADKMYRLITLSLFLCFVKVYLSHRVWSENKPATRHSFVGMRLSPLVHLDEAPFPLKDQFEGCPVLPLGALAKLSVHFYISLSCLRFIQIAKEQNKKICAAESCNCNISPVKENIQYRVFNE